MEGLAPEQLPLVYFASVLALGTMAQWLAWRLRLPSILLLLAFGFGMGWFMHPDELVRREVLFAGVSLSVAVILFEGGLTLQIRELRESGGVVFRLVTLGVLITWTLSAFGCWRLLGFQPGVALLAGGIFTVSGPTVIAPLLRHVRPTRRIGSIVKWEGIVNDPIGAVLAVLVFEAVSSGDVSHRLAATSVWGLVQTAVLGLLIGLCVAVLLIQVLKRFWAPDFLHNILFLAAVLVTFTLANLLQHESGLVAVTVLGVILANQKSVPIRHVTQFKESLQLLLVSCLFIVLSSRLRFADLTQLGEQGLLFLAFLIFVVRPLAVFVSTIGADVNWRERLFLSCMAPRGIVAVAVASVFALRLGAEAEQLVPLTFLVIVGTVTFYGLLAAPLARALELADPAPQGLLFAGADPCVVAMAKALQEKGIQTLLVDTNHRSVAAARMAGLRTCNASVLSEFVQEELELGGVGRLLAMTPNDEVNSLATLEFTHIFGRANVFQLAPEATKGDRRPLAEHMRGRLLFSSEATYYEITRRFARGAQIKSTRLTGEFTFAHYRELYGAAALVLFRIDETGKLFVCAADTESAPKPGDTLVSLAPAEVPEQRAASAKAASE